MSTYEQEVLLGMCHFHTETGTEGGYWAFQDSQFIETGALLPRCKKCDAFLSAEIISDLQNNRDSSGCINQESHEQAVGEVWSYSGLHLLKDGDYLEIFSKTNPTEIIWSGDISLQWDPPFTQSVFGFWIHADQNGVEREQWGKWFMEQFPAKLTHVA